MGICEYCEKDKKLTDEHIFSSVVLRVFDDIAPLTIDPNRGIIHSADPLKKDLCKECNSGLSPSDKYLGQISKQFLKNTITPGTILNFDISLTELWALKTAANLERSVNKNATNPWWHAYRNYFMKIESKPRCADVLFAAWADISPMPGMNPVNTIASHTATIISEIVPINLVKSSINRAWAIKIGHGVFVAISWKTDEQSNTLRNFILKELREWGWLLIGHDNEIKNIPFNAITSACYQVISDPENPQSYKKMGRLKKI